MLPGATNGTAFSVACPSDGGCTAVGGISRGSGQETAVAWTRGPWTAHLVQLPVGFAASWSSYFSVACSRRSTCLLVGTFHRSAAVEFPMAVVESHGVFARAKRIILPTGERAGNAINASCQLAGDRCLIVGTMHPNAGLSRLYEVPVSLGAPPASQFGTTVPLPYTTPKGLPPSVGGGTLYAYGLACADVADCIVVGQIHGGTTATFAFTQLEIHGHWGPVRLAPMPGPSTGGAPSAWLYGASCAGGLAPLASNPCVAVGGYNTSMGTQPLVETFTHGGFHPGSAPATSPATLGTYNAVSCESLHHSCMAVGVLYQSGIAGSEAGHYSVGAVGGFATASLTPVPVAGSEGLVSPRGVSCPSGQPWCVAVGDEAVAPPDAPVALVLTH